MINTFYGFITRPCTAFHFILLSVLYAAVLSWFATDRTITISEGGFPAALIRLSWFFALLLLNNGLWLIISLIKKNNKAYELGPHLFIVSHVFMALVLISDYLHYLMFLEHWNMATITAAVVGIVDGSAPLGIRIEDCIKLVVGLAGIFYLLLFVIKCLPPYQIKVSNHFHRNYLLTLVLIIVALTGLQRVLPSNWHAQQLQKLMPFFQFVHLPQQYPSIDADFSEYVNIKEQQRDLLKTLEAKAKTAVLGSQITPMNILIVHVEALRHDLFNKTHMPNLYQFLQDGAENLPRHYSSSNNTVGSMFGIVSGLSGVLYQHHRAENIALPSLTLLEKLNYQLTVFASCNMHYQEGMSLLFKGFDYYEMVKHHDYRDDKDLIDHYIRRLDGLDGGPRFDYMTLNSTHFPYSYPEAFNQFKPALTNVGLSYQAKDRDKLDKNKQELRNRFNNSVLFVDSLLGELIEALESRSFFDTGILVVLGDHGQEFWEHNRFGHSWSLVNEQTQVVAVIKGPKKINAGYQYSSHSDIMPSILRSMGVETEILSVMTGKALQDYSPDKDFITIGEGVIGTQKPSKAAVVGNGVKVQYRYHPKIRIESIKTHDDSLLDNVNESYIRDLISGSVINSGS